MQEFFASVCVILRPFPSTHTFSPRPPFSLSANPPRPPPCRVVIFVERCRRKRSVFRKRGPMSMEERMTEKGLWRKNAAGKTRKRYSCSDGIVTRCLAPLDAGSIALLPVYPRGYRLLVSAEICYLSIFLSLLFACVFASGIGSVRLRQQLFRLWEGTTVFYHHPKFFCPPTASPCSISIGQSGGFAFAFQKVCDRGRVHKETGRGGGGRGGRRQGAPEADHH